MIDETINLNKQVKPDQVAVFYFYPFKGTKLYDVCKEKGLLTDKENTNYITDSILDLSTISKYELNKKYNEFYRYVLACEIKSFNTPMRYLFKLVQSLLQIFTLDNDAILFINLYAKYSALINKLRRS
jgi:hypothetical protein